MIDRIGLVRAAGRRVPWRALATTAVVVGVALVVRATTVESSDALLPFVRLGTVLLAAAAATCVEDGPAGLTDTTPVGRARRRGLAVGLTALVTVVVWTGVVALSSSIAGRPGTLPIIGLLVELIGLSAVGWAIAGWLVAAGGWQGSGPRASGAVVVLALVSFMVPSAIERLWTAPRAGWRGVDGDWVAVAAGALAVLASISRDPAARWSAWCRPSRRTLS